MFSLRGLWGRTILWLHDVIGHSLVYITFLAAQAFPTFGAIIYTGILASVIINELIAPPLVKYAIVKAGEQRIG